MSNIPLIEHALQYGGRTAIVDDEGTYTYDELLSVSGYGAARLMQNELTLNSAPVAFMIQTGFGYVATQWSIWQAGGIAVPLCVKHPLPEIEYVLDDTGARILVVHEDYLEMLQPVADRQNMRLILLQDLLQTLEPDEEIKLPAISLDQRAMILYTSGTTSKPKGVVSTHANISSQVACLVEAWGWTSEDEILHVLPLHHTHGIVNVLLCALWAGATCRMLPGFDAERVWSEIQVHPITLFMAVPTIYKRLIDHWNLRAASERVQMTNACQKLRLMVSGSAALPVSVLQQWEVISGHRLLERYGMTEIGMALSNPLKGERRPGAVGRPLPGVVLQLVDEAGQVILEDGHAGEVQIKGPSVFLEYWRKPQETETAFNNGWFLTGDIAVKESGYYRLLGRNSVDIIKTGGYKVSALEIEEVLRTHPGIKECAVIGMPDEAWGERVCAGIVVENNVDIVVSTVKDWAKDRLAPYKVPSHIKVLDELPRNVMGKVTKPALRKVFE